MKFLSLNEQLAAGDCNPNGANYIFINRESWHVNEAEIKENLVLWYLIKKRNINVFPPRIIKEYVLNT